MAIDKEALLARNLEEADVEIPGKGSVRVRALSRAEGQKIHGVGMDAGELERKMLAMALVDPVLTEEEVGMWQAAGNVGELSVAVDKAIELSGMEVATPKELMQRFREGA